MDTIILKGILWEDVVNYKKISTTLIFPNCSFKCEKECGKKICQNSPLIKDKDIEVNIDSIITRYLSNPITEAIICQGLEPFDSFDELLSFIIKFREKSEDDIVIYTGYTFDELSDMGYIDKLKNIPHKNIIIKVGRYVPDKEGVYDYTLGVNLASDNQYAFKLP